MKPPKPPKDRVLPEGGPIRPPRNHPEYEEFMEEFEELDSYVPAKFSNKNRKKGRGKTKKMRE